MLVRCSRLWRSHFWAGRFRNLSASSVSVADDANFPLSCSRIDPLMRGLRQANNTNSKEREAEELWQCKVAQEDATRPTLAAAGLAAAFLCEGPYVMSRRAAQPVTIIFNEAKPQETCHHIDNHVGTM